MSAAKRGAFGVMSAETELTAVREQLVNLKRRETELVGLVRQEADEATARARSDEWIRVRPIFEGDKFVAGRTFPTYPAGVKRYFIVAGDEEVVLAVWEVVEHRNTATISQVYGAPAPDEVELQVRRIFDLAKARRGASGGRRRRV